MSELVLGAKEADRIRRVGRYRNNLFLFASEVLGYDKLSPDFHKPMLFAWDEVDRRRFRDSKQIDTLDLWPRDHIKTWCQRARIIRDYLYDPTLTVTWWHAVEEMAQESAVAIGKQLQTNKELRKLFPQGILPSPMAKKFVTASGFNLRSNPIGHAPSMRAWGAGSEATGGHSRIGVLDDPIGYNDVVDSQMPAKKRWYRATVRNVVRSDGFIDAIGTRWDREDLYADWLGSKHWVSTVRACMETDGKPDYQGTPVYLTREQIVRKRDEMGDLMFAFQMMNDPTPQGERPWHTDLEQFCTLKDASGPGFVVVLGDPAPARTGSGETTGARARGDGTKDFWTWGVLKLRARGMRREIILLDLSGSQEWDIDTGFREGCRLMRKWQTPHVAWEEQGQAGAIYEKAMREAARSEGVRLTRHEFTTTYRGKNARFAQLCSRQSSDELFLCESVPARDLEIFLDQCRNWMPLPSGRNSLRFDDYADVVSYSTDPVFASHYPQGEMDVSPWSPFIPKSSDGDASNGTRYVKW